MIGWWWVMAINRILISFPFVFWGERTLHILIVIVFCSSPIQTFTKTPRSHQWVDRCTASTCNIFRIFDGQHPETSASPNKKTTTAKPQVANKANILCYPWKLTAKATFNIGFFEPQKGFKDCFPTSKFQELVVSISSFLEGIWLVVEPTHLKKICSSNWESSPNRYSNYITSKSFKIIGPIYWVTWTVVQQAEQKPPQFFAKATRNG